MHSRRVSTFISAGYKISQALAGSSNSSITLNTTYPTEHLVEKNHIGKLILVRHGETDSNKNETWAGWHDTKLTEKGRQQARDLGKILKENDFSPDLVYTTELSRAHETTKIALSIMGCTTPIIKDRRIIEQNVGSFTGTKKTDESKLIVQGPHSRAKAMDINHPNHHLNSESVIGETMNGLGTESRHDVVIRTNLFYEEQLKKDLKAGKKILVVAHSNSLKALITNIANKTGLKIGNAAPMELKFRWDEKGEPVFTEMAEVKFPSSTVSVFEINNLKESSQVEKTQKSGSRE